jgi:hypothetical protein
MWRGFVPATLFNGETMGIKIYKAYNIECRDNQDGYSYSVKFGDTIIHKDDFVYPEFQKAHDAGTIWLRQSFEKGERNEVYFPQIYKYN